MPRGRARWILGLAGGGTASIDAAAAQATGVGVGGRWDAKAAARVEAARADLALFTRAMRLLARSGPTPRADLARRLGGDAAARRTVAALVRNGWVA